MVALTEQILSSATTKATEKSLGYFAADAITQWLYLIGTGYLCAVIARSNRLAIVFLTAPWSIGRQLLIGHIVEVGAPLV
jgi:hypothetical protein